MVSVNRKFIYFIANNVESVSWLKEELKINFPFLKPSYSRGTFLTFLNPEAKDFPITVLFARHWGYSQFKGKRQEVLDYFAQLKTDLPLIDCEKMKGEQIPYGKYFEMIPVFEEEYFLGYSEKFTQNNYVLGSPEVSLPVDSPSRAYLKISEVIKVLELPIDEKSVVIEFGSSPGGAVFALLEKGAKVYGVDTGKMHERCLANSKFVWIEKSIQDCTDNDFLETPDWILSDMNLSPFSVLNELKKFSERTKIKPNNGLILTLKMTKKELLKKIKSLKGMVRSLGYEVVFMGQLPSHHTEFSLVAKRLK